MQIWTLMRHGPFVLGGNHKWRPHKTRVANYAGPFDVGRGFTAFVITAPDGRTLVVDGTGGGIVGDNLDQVRADIAACTDVDFMRHQVAESAIKRAEAVELDPDTFWRRYGIKVPANTSATEGRCHAG